MTSPEVDRNRLAIRPASVEDCDVLTALMLRSSAYAGRYRTMIENYPVTSGMVDRDEVWVAEWEGELVGFYRLDRANADLDLMFVADEVQGIGIGRMIFQHMKDVAAAGGLREVQIVAHPPAVEFYLRMGALPVGVRKAKSPEGWDRPILKLTVAA